MRSKRIKRHWEKKDLSVFNSDISVTLFISDKEKKFEQKLWIITENEKKAEFMKEKYCEDLEEKLNMFEPSIESLNNVEFNKEHDIQIGNQERIYGQITNIHNI